MPAEAQPSLFDRIKVLSEQLPVSHIFDNTALGKSLAAVVHYLEHGDDILVAAEKDAQWLIDQLSGPKEKRGAGIEVPSILTKNDPDPQVVGGAGTAEVAALQAQIDQLSSALQSRIAAEHVANTSVTSEPVPEVASPLDTPQVSPTPPTSVSSDVSPLDTPDPVAVNDVPVTPTTEGA